MTERKPATASISGRHSVTTKLDIKESAEHFDLYGVPRRIINDAVKKNSSLKIKQKLKYRKVNPYEKNRGEKIPLFELSVESFSLFGLGVGQYFVQLLFYSLLFACMGMILISTMDTYAKEYDHPKGYDSVAQIWSVSCAEPVEVVATENCPDSASSCVAKYRDNCPLHKSAVITDLVFCSVFFFCIFILQYFEGEMEEDLDEAIQSPQDYSIMVTNPPLDATDPDEWYSFFAKFGNVKYVTVSRKNKTLGNILYRKYQFISDYYGGLSAMEDVDPESESDVNSLRYLEKCIRQDLEEEGDSSSPHLDPMLLRAASAIRKQGSSSKIINDDGVPTPGTWDYFWYLTTPSMLYREAMLLYNGGKPYYQHMLAKLDLEVCTAYRNFYAANQVYISFNLESDKRKCLQKLEVADIKHYLPSVYGDEDLIRFRGEHVLNCVECPEADNIIYANTESSTLGRRKLQLIAGCVSGSVLLGLYYFIEVFRSNSLLLTAVVGIVDVNLPFIYYYFASMEDPPDYDDLHDSVLTKLFIARFMISVVFTYFVNVEWADMLTPHVVNNILVIQITVCLFAPVCTFADSYGIFERQFVSRALANTREDMNNWYRGSYWLLSERYSCFAKVITVSLFYALLTPFGVFIAAFALFLTYWLDRYLLLRKWRASPMMDATMSNRFRQMVCFAVAAHMYVTVLLIYGWPHDSAVKVSDIDDTDPDAFHFAYADKIPPWFSYTMAIHPEWMQQSQIDTLTVYNIFTLLAVLLTIYIWVGQRIVEGLRFLFYTVNDSVGDAQDICYDDLLVTMRAYCPVIPWGDKELVFADIGNMCAEQRLFYAANGDVGLINLSELVPQRKWANCMASVRYYAETELEKEKREQMESQVSPTSTKGGSALAKQPSKFIKFIDDISAPAPATLHMAKSASEKWDADFSIENNESTIGSSSKKSLRAGWGAASISPETGVIQENQHMYNGGSGSADPSVIERPHDEPGSVKDKYAPVALRTGAEVSPLPVVADGGKTPDNVLNSFNHDNL